MEILIFKDTRWQDIQEQDNPANDRINHKTYGKIRPHECLIICKPANKKTKVGKDGYIVIFIPIEGDVIRMGLFWNIKNATIFAEALSKELEYGLVNDSISI